MKKETFLRMKEAALAPQGLKREMPEICPACNVVRPDWSNSQCFWCGFDFMNMKPYKSTANWPDGRISTDEHPTERAARIVAARLMREGNDLGLPVSVSVSPAEPENNNPPCSSVSSVVEKK
jgi:hypothetical protein